MIRRWISLFFLDVAKNPGPYVPPLYNIQIHESFNYAEVYNLHNSPRSQQQQQQPWLSVYQSTCLDWATTQSWIPTYHDITHRNNNINNTRPVTRTRNPGNCIKINIRSNRQNYNRTQPLVHGGQRKRFSIAHLNAESLKSRACFIEVKEMALKENFDILSISETWVNTSVTNASVNIEGYNIYRLDLLRKKGGGVCVYVKGSSKVKTSKDLSWISDSGLHQLWLQIQHKHLTSVIVCVVYRPPE